jgi:hypothetical protein
MNVTFITYPVLPTEMNVTFITSPVLPTEMNVTFITYPVLPTEMNVTLITSPVLPTEMNVTFIKPRRIGAFSLARYDDTVKNHLQGDDNLLGRGNTHWSIFGPLLARWLGTADVN